MFSLKNSFADCPTCPLLEAPSCILETNCKDDLSKVDIVIVSENPGKDEVKKGIPLIGRAGQTFRKPFDKYLKSKCNWLLTNCVLCVTLNEDKTTGNPTDEIIDRCKVNCFNIIKQCNPKLIVVMGTSPMKAFGIAKDRITSRRGEVFKWEGYDVLVTIHPSFVNRNLTYKADFEGDIKLAAELIDLGESFERDDTKDMKIKEYKKGIFRYKIPEKFYTEDYRLIDIQYLSKSNEILYIFRDKDNKKVYHKESDRYVCYFAMNDIDARKIIPYDDLNQIELTYKQKVKLDPNITYEGDLKLTVKHAMDYYHYNIEETPKTCSNILFCDIEIDAGIDNKSFPDPKQALYPINMISCIYQDQKKKVCYVLDNKSEPIIEQNGVDIKVFNSEKTLLLTFIKDLKKNDPDFMSGWNFIGFDMEYVYNRLPRVKIQQSSMSKFNEFFVDSFRYTCKLPGIVVLDQLHLYKMFTFTKKENYKLGTIGKDEVNMEKIQMDYAINEMYYKQLNKLIEYNIRDTDILELLEEKLGHINLLNELRVICNASFDSASSSFGQVDSIIVSFLREKGLASKNSDPHISKESYPGAYVHPPIPGVYDKICDFDFTSLYPSIISTYNIGVNCFKYRLIDPTQGYDLTYHPEQLLEEVEVIVDPTYKAKRKKIDSNVLIKEIKDNDYVFTINGCIYEGHKKNPSIYSQVLELLLSSRRAYKKKMLDAKEEGNKMDVNFFNTKQLVYKVLANSLYGVVANKAFRFFDLSCAAAITLGGQEALKRTLIEGEEYMRHMHLKEKLRVPKELTKREMYAKNMPDRVPKYIITGDTDSIFVCFNDFKDAINDEKIKEYCDKLQVFLNETIMTDIVNKHNINDIKYNKLDLKNELVISRGLFLAKKRYAINVTNNEGRVVDEMKYMGLEIKRSDYPSRSKVLMKGLLKRIMKMKTVSASKLIKFLESEKSEFLQLIKNGDKSVARPVSYGKKISDYKTIPQGVRAMENFNSIAYKKFVPGDKGYMFRVLGVDLDKAPDDVKKNYELNFIKPGKTLEVVAIPDEEPYLPNYFIPDVKGNIKFAYEDRHELLMAPLKQGMKTAGLLTI